MCVFVLGTREICSWTSVECWCCKSWKRTRRFYLKASMCINAAAAPYQPNNKSLVASRISRIWYNERIALIECPVVNMRMKCKRSFECWLFSLLSLSLNSVSSHTHMYTRVYSLCDITSISMKDAENVLTSNLTKKKRAWTPSSEMPNNNKHQQCVCENNDNKQYSR